MRPYLKIVYCLSTALCLILPGCSSENPRVVTRLNDDASQVGELPSNPLQGKVITSWIDKQHLTMSTLFGNDVAVQYARNNPQHDYPAGSVLSVVTWKQQEDPRWFGGKIPATPASVEFVTVGTSPDNHATYAYQYYEGAPLKTVSAQNGPTPNERAAYLLAQRAAVMP